MSQTVLTPTCQEFKSADLLAALESSWAAIRGHHPDVPAVVMVVASGSPTRAGQPMRWGHFASMRWQHGDQRIPEVLVSGEGLSRGANDILATLLHEAAHALADVRQVKETSRQGRWHNKHFATLATELGLTVSKDAKLGWSVCTVTDDTSDRYRPQTVELHKALHAYRHREPVGESKERPSSNNGLSCLCECGRKIRIAKSVWEAGPIICTLCDMAFLPEETGDGA